MEVVVGEEEVSQGGGKLWEGKGITHGGENRQYAVEINGKML